MHAQAMSGIESESKAELLIVFQSARLGWNSKLLFTWLWDRVGGRPDRLTLSAGLVAHTFGVSERAAGRAIAPLIDVGLVEWIAQKEHLAYVNPPEHLVGLRVDRSQPDDQRQLFETSGTESAPEPSAVLVPEPPTVAAVIEPQESMRQAFERAVGRSPPTKNAAADIRYPDPNLNRDIGEAKRRQAVSLCVDELASRIQKDAGDPDLHPGVALKVAAAIADGKLEWLDVKRAIVNARKARLAGKTPATWIYLVGALKRLFSERGLTWSGRRAR